MSRTWRRTTLGTLAEFRNGVNYDKSNFGEGIKVINVGDFGQHLIAPLDGLGQIRPEGIVRKEHLLRDGDVLFVRSNGNRELIGRSLLVREIQEPVTHSAFTIRARFNLDEAWPAFFAYLFRTHFVRDSLSAQGNGTNISNLNQSILSALAVPCPPLPTQRRITEVLTGYDNLVENNTKRIKILEEMARSLYREWFVNFRFPGHKKTKFVRSPLGTIPEGWRVVRIAEISTKIGSGATPKGGEAAYREVGITLIRSMNVYDAGFSDDGLAFLDDEQAEGLANVAVEPQDILLNITGASVARCCMVPDRLLPARVNQHVMIIRAAPDLCDPHFLLASINSEQRKKLLLSCAEGGGATRQALTKETVSNFQIQLPPRPLVARFSSSARDIALQREVLAKKNQVLRATRDLLLPRLISGDVDVSSLGPILAAS
jgi:type I restriction enzyme S subunit